MKTTSPGYVLGFMAVICIVVGLGVSAVHYSTLSTLRRNERFHRDRTIAQAFVLPVSGTDARTFEKAITDSIDIDTLRPAGRRPIERFVNRNSGDVGFVFRGMGFWDEISGILVMNRDLSSIVNIAFLDQKETPGLGARITEPSFTDQFKGLEIDWDAPADRRLVIGASSNPQARNRVDAITGASQTSMALGQFLNRELAALRAALPQEDR